MGFMGDSLELPAAQERGDFAELSIAVVAGLAFAVTALFMLAVPLAGHMVGSRDFVAYWATGQQLVHHANPYDRNAVMDIEHSVGLAASGVLMMRNPPWALPLAYPLGFLGLRLAAVVWSLVLLVCLLLSVRMVRVLHGSPPNRIHWLALSFTPALICLVMGQTSLFALLGLVLFLRYHRPQPFAAGVSLWLCMLKPHLFLPFAAALAAWIVVSRSYKVLAGAAASIAVTSLAAYFIDPAAWLDYSRMMRAPNIEQEFVPCLSDALRYWIRPQATWLQYLPAGLCCVWALFYYWKRRAAWDWTRNSGPLMLVSLLFAPYCFLYDQGLAIPALMDAAYATRSRVMLTVLALLILIVDIELGSVRIISGLYLWTAPAWFGWYLLAHRLSGVSISPETS
jgi:hypothetical protein